MTSTVLSTVIWGSAALLAGSILTVYLGGLRRRERRDRERAAEAERLGITKPAGQYPYVDPSICIGCGACIRACPEGDVLGIVGGLAVVIDGARCIGIGACAKACPVEGIELAMGDLRGRADVPQMDERNQTNVPGLFVAGELGGLALIRNAIGQGRDTVRWIAAEAARIRPRPTSDPLDLAIVGAGPAGLSAALAAIEAGLSYAVFEQETSLGGTIHHYPRRKLTHTQPVEIPLHGALTKGEYSKEELLELFGGLVSRHRLAVRFDHKVLDVSRLADGFQLTTTSGVHRARFALLTLGRRGTPRKLGVPGEELGKVMYQVRDADHYRGRRILCVGGGDSAIEAAIGLARQPGSEVALSYRGERFHRVKRRNQELLENLSARGRIRPLLGSQVRTIDAHQVLLDTSDGELVLDNDFVFVLIGGEPPFPLLRQAGIRFGNEAA